MEENIKTDTRVEEVTTPAYAGFLDRFLAFSVDSLLLSIVNISIMLILGRSPYAYFHMESIEEVTAYSQSPLTMLVSLLGWVITGIFSILFWVNYDGATPGKKLMGIKVTRANGENVNYVHALVRFIGTIVSSFTLYLGYFVMFFNKKKQTLHDLIAGTVVVKTGAKPKTAIAVILTVICFLHLFILISVQLTKSVELAAKAMKDSGAFTNMTGDGLSLLSPEAKTHYDKTQELFVQIHGITELDKMKPLTDQIISEAKLAIEDQPDSGLLWLNLGNAYSWPSTKDATGSKADQLASYQKALELEPENTIYMNNVGDVLISLGRNDEAVLMFQKALRLYSESGYSHISLGRAYRNLGVYDEARIHYQEGIEIFEKNNNTGTFDSELLQARKELSGLPK